MRILYHSSLNRPLLFHASVNKFTYSSAYSYNINNGKISKLLKEGGPQTANTSIKKKNLIYPGQSGLGRIIGNYQQKNQIFMPAYVGEWSSKFPKYSLVTVNLKNGRPKLFENGNTQTRDWIVGEDGTVYAREDHNRETNTYRIATKRNGVWEDVFVDKNAPLAPLNLKGINPDKSGLIVTNYLENGEEALLQLNWDGSFSSPIFKKSNAEIDYVISDSNRNIYGVSFTGMTPSYGFLDENLNDAMNSLIKSYPGFSILLTSWSDDWKKMIVQVSGGNQAGGFFIYNTETREVSKLIDSRDIPAEAIGEVITIEYPARDGTKIPSLLTWPVGKSERENLPTIILPHGGPESYDQMYFDWLAQYFSNRGYLVLQPNFRGSTGFGWDFRQQGRGQWGGLMQDDISDGIHALVKNGYSDPDKVCIVGASYGGYAALAGGSFTPELYKCIIAFAPVTDLPRILYTERLRYGENSHIVEYWTRVIGDRKTDKEKLKSISPIHHAEKFTSPVLLIHGNKDSVVNINQSVSMHDALKKAGKEVEFVKVKGGDHWLSTSETRLETLQAIDSFIAKHNPAN